MDAELRRRILAKLGEWEADHQPCDPGADCMHRAVEAVHAVLVEIDRWLPGWPPHASAVERVVAQALGFPTGEPETIEAPVEQLLDGGEPR